MPFRFSTTQLGAIAIIGFFLAGMLLAAQRVRATPDVGAELAAASAPLNSPLTPLDSPLAIPESTENNDVELSFTPAYTLYLPIVSRKPTTKFGTETDSSFEDFTGAKAIEDAGFSWYRHMAVSWADYEPISGVYTMTPIIVGGTPMTGWVQALDDGVERATASGLQTMIVIRDSPAWATVGGVRGCDAVTPSLYAHFAQFVSTVITKYEQSPYYVKYYELWNEPDASLVPHTTKDIGCWRSASDYVNMLKVVYPKVKQDHPNVKIINGGLVDLGTWAHEFITSGISYIDVLAYHAYESLYNGYSLWPQATDATDPARYLKRLATIRSWLPPTSTIEIFMNEGAAIPETPQPSLTDTIRIQAYFAAFMAAQMIGENLEQYSWWVSFGRSSSYGTFYTDTNGYHYVTNTLYTALAFGMSKVYQATYITTTRSSAGASIIKLYNASERELWLMWNTKGSNSTAFTHTFGFTPTVVWDVWGNVLPITASLYMTDPNRVVWVQPYP